MEEVVYQQLEKKNRVLGLETKLLKTEDYKKFLDVIKDEDKKLYEISKSFSDLTTETKRVLDTIKEKSEGRKKEFGVTEDHQHVDHHRHLPQDVKQKLLEAATEVNELHFQFDDFTKKTNNAVV